MSRKLAEAYLNMGLYSSALLECEGILQLQPNSPDIVALMGEIESRTAPASNRSGNGNGNGGDFGLINEVGGNDQGGSLIALSPSRNKSPNGKNGDSAKETAVTLSTPATTATNISPSS